MMIESLRKTIQQIIDFVEGGVSKSIQSIIDNAIDNDLLSQKDFDDNEIDILAMIDNSIFTCEKCDWTLPIEEMSTQGEWSCIDCD